MDGGKHLIQSFCIKIDFIWIWLTIYKIAFNCSSTIKVDYCRYIGNFYSRKRPENNRIARFFASVKTHKFENFEDINLEELKLRPIIDQTGTCFYNAGKVIASYLQPLTHNDYVISDTQTFPSLLKDVPLLEDEEDVSYDVESLFTSIPINETIEYICDEIYIHGKLEPMCKRSIFKKLLYKLTKECTFSANGKLYKQIDGVSMGGPVSVVMSGCFMNKMEREVVIPMQPKFYKRYVDDTYNRRKKNSPDLLFQRLNSYHINIRFTLEVQPTKFLDTKIVRSENSLSFFVAPKDTKLPFHWSSAVPKKYKRNIIVGELHRAKRISSDFSFEKDRIFSKFVKAGYPRRFIQSVFRSFDNPDEELIIPRWLFPDMLPKIFIKLPYCRANEEHCWKFLERIDHFTADNVKIIVTWITRKVKSLFPIKDKVIHKSCVIYEGTCSCGEKYIGETKRNAEVRWAEHNNTKKKSEPAKHLKLNIGHVFSWKVLCAAPNNYRKRKVIEAYYIRRFLPTINDQLDIKSVYLFRNGVT